MPGGGIPSEPWSPMWDPRNIDFIGEESARGAAARAHFGNQRNPMLPAFDLAMPISRYHRSPNDSDREIARQLRESCGRLSNAPRVSVALSAFDEMIKTLTDRLPDHIPGFDGHAYDVLTLRADTFAKYGNNREFCTKMPESIMEIVDFRLGWGQDYFERTWATIRVALKVCRMVFSGINSKTLSKTSASSFDDRQKIIKKALEFREPSHD